MLSKLVVIAAIVGAAIVGDPAAALAQAKADSVTLTERAAKVGDKWTEEKTETADMIVTVNSQKIAMKTERTEKRSIEVLAVDKTGPTKAKYTFVTDTETKQSPKKRDGGPTPDPGQELHADGGRADRRRRRRGRRRRQEARARAQGA